MKMKYESESENEKKMKMKNVKSIIWLLIEDKHN